MNRAIVIKTVGNPEISEAIVNGMKSTLPVTEIPNDTVIEVVQAEIDRQRIQRALVRVAIGNGRTSEDYALLVRKAYGDYGNQPHHGKVYNAILGLWGLAWMTLLDWVEYFQTWNRT